jgi:predicted negative regulator of RcsB-dependent stress response
MATNLDLQEQEQIESIKAFWKQYGNLITWTLILALGAFSAWNGWNWYQRDQGFKAGAMFDELDRAVAGGEPERAARVFADLRERFPKTAWTQHGGLAAARAQFDAGDAEGAQASLRWVADNGAEPELATIARLRLAGLLIDAGQPDEALQLLAGPIAPGFEGLAADRRGDALMAQDKPEEARSAYQQAWASMADTLDYRRVVEAKLTALAAPPGGGPAGSAGAAR